MSCFENNKHRMQLLINIQFRHVKRVEVGNQLGIGYSIITDSLSRYEGNHGNNVCDN